MYTIKTPKTRDDFKAYYALRYKVLGFVDEIQIIGSKEELEGGSEEKYKSKNQKYKMWNGFARTANPC